MLENLEIVESIVLIVSVIIALSQYITNLHRERKRKEVGTYDALDNKFIEFQLICLEKPYLDIFDIPDKTPLKLTEEQKKEELVALSILMALFERAYLMYKNTDFKGGTGQWEGWNEVMDRYTQRDNFIKAWEKNGFGWDKEFEALINRKINKGRKNG